MLLVAVMLLVEVIGRSFPLLAIVVLVEPPIEFIGVVMLIVVLRHARTLVGCVRQSIIRHRRGGCRRRRR